MYDQEFRQSRAGNASSRWDQIDTCLYTQLFSGRAEESENWCSHCFTADHSRRRCPFQGQPRRVPGELGASIPGVGASRASQVCHKFNRFNGDCRWGPDCPYRHICSKCGGCRGASSRPSALEPRCKRTSGELEQKAWLDRKDYCISETNIERLLSVTGHGKSRTTSKSSYWYSRVVYT